MTRQIASQGLTERVLWKKLFSYAALSLYTQAMESVTRNISDMSPSDRLAIEHVIGHSLQESQRIVIQVFDLNSSLDVSRAESWTQFKREKTAEQLAQEQGIGPMTDLRKMVFPDWPEGESVDDFIASAKGMHRNP